MERLDCSQGMAVAAAIRRGGLDATLAAHAAECEVCGGVVAASRYMAALGSDNDGRLPDAGLIYWRARLSESAAKAERAESLLDWMEMALAAVVIGAAGWVVWNWLAIEGLIAGFLTGSQLGQVTVSTLIVALSVAGLLGLLAAMLAYPGLVDE